MEKALSLLVRGLFPFPYYGFYLLLIRCMTRRHCFRGLTGKAQYAAPPATRKDYSRSKYKKNFVANVV